MTTIRSVSSYQNTPLDQGWEITEVPPGTAAAPGDLEKGERRWVRAACRGTVASILQTAGLWSLGMSRNFDDADWWYRCRFVASHQAPNCRTYLRLEGLATIADVWLNGVFLLRSENMYRTHCLDVTSLLRPDNELCILFHSLSHLLLARRPRPRWRTKLVEQQQLRWFRTTLLGRMPSFCPPVAPVGPWRPVVLEQRRGLSTLQAQVDVDLEARCVRASLRLEPLAGLQAHDAQLLVGGSRTVMQSEETSGVALQLNGELRLGDAALWWPHTHGAQPLYAVQARLRLGDEEVVIDCDHVGFRQLTLDTGTGEDFALHVNGVPVFCRGACWIPLDVVGLGVAQYRVALETARAAGMNMLRIPGNTLYEVPVFYELCDQLGILVWQDFMFASMDYPSDDSAFMANVRAEAEQQLSALRQRPCLAVLCGGSEVEQQAAMLGLPRDTWSNAIFQQLLPELCRSFCPGVLYWPSSPGGGDLPFQINFGVSHYYGVGAYLRPLVDARHSEVRFAAECLAFANVPEDSTLEACFTSATSVVHHPQWKSRVPRDVGAGWDFEDVRDHYLELLFGVDPMRLRYSDTGRYLLLSRIVSGEVMARTFAEWRRLRSTCHGALVWLYQDLWPGAGWGLIDALGIPKASYYYLKRAFKPLCLFITDEGLNGLYVHVLNETANHQHLGIQVTLYRHCEVLVADGHVAVSVAPRGGLELPMSKLFLGFLDTSYAYRFGPPSHDLVVARLLNQTTGETLDSAFFFPLGFPAPVHADLGLSTSVQPLADGSYTLWVQTTKYAQSVVISAAGFLPDDNYFHLEPHGKRAIALRPRQPAGKLRGTLTAINTTAMPMRLNVDLP